MTYAVRPATLADIDAVADLEAECLGSDAWSHGLVREGIAGALPTVTYLVALTDERVVGHAVVSVAGDVAELQRIAVAPASRRQGTATLLLDAVLASVVGRQVERVLLEVREDNEPARAFYRRTGFTELARRPRYYADGTTAVVMERPV